MSDLDARCFVRRGNTLVAADFAAQDFLAGIPNGREVTVTIRQPRSPQHHRWFFGMLHKVIANTECWADEDDLLEDLKDAVGHVHPGVNVLTGKPRRQTKSISFAAMGEDKFTRFKNRCVFVLCQALGWDPTTLMEEADALQAPPTAPTDEPPQSDCQRESATPELEHVERGR